MKAVRFLRIIKRYLEGKSSPREQVVVQEWLNALAEKNTSQEQWSSQDKKKNLELILERVHQQPKKEVKIVALPFTSPVWRMAASITLLISIGAILWLTTRSKNSDNDQITITQYAHQAQKIILPDNTLVWLKGEASISYPQKFDSVRHITFQGEALFEVAKDPSHPFVIQSGKLTTTVLGTSFNLKASSHYSEVTVFTGKVRLTSSGNSLVVVPKETAFLDNNASLSKERTDQSIASELIKGTQYNMYFDDRPAGEVFDQLEEKFNVVIQTSNSALRECRISADFTDQSLVTTLQMMAEVLHLKYRIENNKVILEGEGCSQ